MHTFNFWPISKSQPSNEEKSTAQN